MTVRRPDRTAAVAAARRLHAAGDLAGAEDAYRRVLASDAGAADAWHGLGCLAHERGFHAEAVALIGRALRAKPRTGHYHVVLGLALAALGEIEAARASLSLAAILEPADWRAHAAHGRVLARLGRTDEAAAALERALALEPSAAEVLHALAVLDLARGDPAQAAARFRQIAERRPDDAAALGNWGAALQAAGRFEEAETVLSEALARSPDTAEALSNRGLARLGLGRLDAALDDLVRAHAIAPADHGVMRNLASAHYERDERHEARALLETVLARDPADRDARLNLGTLDLAEGRLAEGWRGYASRPGRPGNWTGGTLHDGTLRLDAEQGLGDTIMFLRYVPLAAARAGGRVVLALPAALHRLAHGLEGVREIVTLDGAPDAAARARLGDLAALFSPSLDRIPPPARFAIDPDRAEGWRRRLAREHGADRPVVGLAWSGNPAYRQDRRRSIPPACLVPLLALPDVAFVSLQPATALDGVPAILVPGADLAETAALLSCLDAVVTVDTVIVHLAGSLGVPTLLLDRRGGDWRWGRSRADTAWYRSVGILRDGEHDQARVWTGPVAGAVEAFRRGLPGRS